MNVNGVSAVVAVKDINKSKEFYEAVLGLVPENEQEGVAVVYRCGTGNIQVYQSQFAGTNQATSASWEAEDVKSVVDELKNKGVVFEHYDSMPGVKFDGDVHVMGDMQAAWFKDPDGNILCVANHA